MVSQSEKKQLISQRIPPSAITHEETHSLKQWQLTPCSRYTNSKEKPFPSKKTACMLRHKDDCHERCGPCSKATYTAHVTKAMSEVKKSLSRNDWLKDLTSTADKEIRDMLGLGPRGNPHAFLGRPIHISARRTFVSKSFTRRLWRCGKAEILHSEGPRNRRRKGSLPHRAGTLNMKTPSKKKALNLEDSTFTGPNDAKYV